MSFESVLTTEFPGAMATQAFLSRMQGALGRHGFARPHVLMCASLCRDEITAPLRRELAQAWGGVFDLGGLGGAVAAGRSGFAAAVGHAPVQGGRERLACTGLTHLAIDAGGAIGPCQRPGRATASTACGALGLVQAILSGATPRPDDDRDDAELLWLLERLSSRAATDAPPDLLALTRLTYESIREDVARHLAATVDPARTDAAVATGILIHGPQGRDYIWPGEAYVVVHGVRTDVTVG